MLYEMIVLSIEIRFKDLKTDIVHVEYIGWTFAILKLIITDCFTELEYDTERATKRIDQI